MAPPDSPPTSTDATPVATPSPIPPPVPVETHPNRQRSDPNRLAPEDAYKAISPPRLRPLTTLDGSVAVDVAAAALRPAIASLRAPPAIPPVAARLEQERRARVARKRRKPHVWKKLLWIKQSYPDNYTDPTTFLDHLQRNPKLRPYDFWPLVADSTVIVQHICAVAIFVSAYAGIYQDRLSPVAVVACGTFATLLGWVMWDHWMGEEEADTVKQTEMSSLADLSGPIGNIAASSPTEDGNFGGHINGRFKGPPNTNANGNLKRGLGLTLSTENLTSKTNGSTLGNRRHIQSLSRSSVQSISPIDPLAESLIEPFPNLKHVPVDSPRPLGHYIPQSPTTLPPSMSHRNQARLKTFKSALLIYFALLGLSPILKSLTKSTSSDSIWALATWLLIINIFFFDYGSQYVPHTSRGHLGHRNATGANVDVPPTVTTVNTGSATPVVGAPGATSTAPGTTGTNNPDATVRAPPFPSSLSTNAAVMASTVLASRLPTTTAVFSLSLFSIQVFGLFPVFRRHLRHKSLPLHVMLTVALVWMASFGLGLILSRSHTHTHGDCGYCLAWIWHVALHGTVGACVGGFGSIFIMGGCSWWLISLQRYKNVVIGPWDPARPVLAGGVYGRSRGGTD